jgi:hypothetical protein
VGASKVGIVLSKGVADGTQNYSRGFKSCVGGWFGNGATRFPRRRVARGIKPIFHDNFVSMILRSCGTCRRGPILRDNSVTIRHDRLTILLLRLRVQVCDSQVAQQVAQR